MLGLERGPPGPLDSGRNLSRFGDIMRPDYVFFMADHVIVIDYHEIVMCP